MRAPATKLFQPGPNRVTCIAGLLLVGCFGIQSGSGSGSAEEGKKFYAEARLYLRGEGRPIDEKKAKALVLQAVDSEDPKAGTVLSLWVARGEFGFAKNEKDALDRFRKQKPTLEKLKLSGDEQAAVLLALGNLELEPADESHLAPLRELALRGNPEALVGLARANRKGVGTEISPTQSYAWAKQAADQGDVEGMYLVGTMLCLGQGVGRDAALGLVWLRKAADRGLPKAQNFLGALLCEGKYLPADPVESSEWLQEAARQEYAKAEQHLARHYLEGRGVPVDLQEALRWVSLSEAHGLKDEAGLREAIQAAIHNEQEARKEPAASEKNRESASMQWTLAGPFDLPLGDPKAFFDSFAWQDFPPVMQEGEKVTLHATERRVKKFTAQSGGFSLDNTLGARTNCFALGRLEVHSPKQGRRLISVGSDDAVKIWLNGKEIHRHWVARSLRADEDLVMGEFQEGKNDLAVLIQNFGGPWGMAVQVPDPETLNQLLRQAVMHGDVERAEVLLRAGGNPNANCLQKLMTHTEMAYFMRRERLLALLEDHGGRVRWYHPVRFPRLTARVLPWLARADSRPRPGLSLLVSSRGKILLELGWGMAHVETESKITPETRFPIGSITKQFVSAAVFCLQEEGKLQLTNTLSQYFPSFPRGDQIQIRQMLDHTSGIYSYTAQNDFLQKSLQPASGKDVLAYIQKWPFGDYPGRRFEYSNSNYYLAGLIVEKVSAQSLADYLQTKFFQPLGMRQTSLGQGNRLIPGMASAYRGKERQVERANTWNFDWAEGSGGIISTPRDMDLWMRALYGGKIMQEASLREMLRVGTHAFASPEKNAPGYACGVVVNEINRVRTFSHTGYLPPYSASAIHIPESDANIIILANADGGFEDLNTERIQAGLMSLFFRELLGPSTRDQAAGSFSAERVEQLTGTYDDGKNLYELRYQADRWSLVGPEKGEILRVLGTDRWLCRDCGRGIRAVTSSSGEVAGLEIEAGSLKTFAARRPRFDPEQLENLKLLPDYVGKYSFPEGMGSLDLKFEKGHLVAQWPGNPARVAFKNIGRDEFAATAGNVRIEFERSRDGKVSRVINRHAGYTWELSKQPPAEISGPVPEVIK